MSSNDESYLASLGSYVGAPEAALRLLITLLAGYPISFFYKKYIQSIQNLTFHHLYFAICGIYSCYFNYGLNTSHSLLAVFLTYVFLHTFQWSSALMVGTNFVFHMMYLLIGYYYTESNEYDILWTMPHCVLTLRMIGLAFDISDGKKSIDKLSNEQKECCLPKIPSFLELYAFGYFPASFLVGPQFPFRRYQRFINGDFRAYTGSTKTGLIRLFTGLTYLTVRQIGSMMLPDVYFLTDAFANKSFLMRAIYLGLWGKFTLYKYISCWLITEGALICLGFSYNGQTDDNKPNWFGCSNVKLWLLETGITMQDYVHSFNVNTNLWVGQYIYKRLKFLNNRLLSYAGALIFLAVWHGFHSGYYMSFALEFIVVTTEKQMSRAYKKLIVPYLGIFVQTTLYQIILFGLLKAYNVIFMGWCLAPFTFLHSYRWLQVFRAVNFYGFIWLGVWHFMYCIYNIYELLGKRGKGYGEKKLSVLIATSGDKHSSHNATKVNYSTLDALDNDKNIHETDSATMANRKTPEKNH